MDKSIRVLVANRPRLMRELVTISISAFSDIEVVGEVESEIDILEAVRKTHPDFLIVASDDSGRPPSFCDSIFRNHTDTKILAITPDLESGALYWANPSIHRSQIEASEDGILRTLRGELELPYRIQ